MLRPQCSRLNALVTTVGDVRTPRLSSACLSLVANASVSDGGLISPTKLLTQLIFFNFYHKLCEIQLRYIFIFGIFKDFVGFKPVSLIKLVIECAFTHEKYAADFHH